MAPKSKILLEARQIEHTELPFLLGAERYKSLATPPGIVRIAVNPGNFKVKCCNYYVRIIVNN